MTLPAPDRPEVVRPGEFPIVAVHLNHGHIHGMCRGLVEAGATLKWVFDPDPRRVEEFQRLFPGVPAAASEEQVLEDPQVRLVASASVPEERGPFGCRVMEHGKDYFTDKPALTRLEHLEAARRGVSLSGRKYMVYFSERLHAECAVYAGQLVAGGAIGRVVQVIGLGPHRLRAAERPAWFFRRRQAGGILCDLGSHQIDQFLFYSGARRARVAHARTANVAHPEHPELEDFGEACLEGENGASAYFRVDWLTPRGLSTWGDGRLFLLGTEGFIELRKHLDLATERSRDHLLLADRDGERHLRLEGQVGFPFFGRLIRDCLERTETALSQEHVFTVARLCLEAQALADGAGLDGAVLSRG